MRSKVALAAASAGRFPSSVTVVVGVAIMVFGLSVISPIALPWSTVPLALAVQPGRMPPSGLTSWLAASNVRIPRG